MNPDGSAKSVLTNDRLPHHQLSACRDGKHLVFTTWRDGNIELWRSDPDGSNAARISDKPIMGMTGCGPDSNSAIYAADGEFRRSSFDGGAPVKLDLPLNELHYSSDGKMFLYGIDKVENGQLHAKILVMPAEGGGAPLQTFDAPFSAESFRFTPDNKAIAFMLTRDRATNIWEQPMSGGDIVQLTHFTSGRMFAFSFSPDGKHLAFSRGARKTDVVMMSGFR